MKRWFRRNAKEISTACFFAAITAGVMGVVFTLLSLLIAAVAIIVIGTIAFVNADER